ncbi:MAG: hypothetical protein QOD57_1501, partial [Actinomycetota bacterium]|nr:hypothetical protein [Actinomycetota bacterium]
PLPFTGSPTEVAAPPATPVADPTTTTTTVPVVDPTPPVDGTTTTTTVPPVVVDPVPNPVPVLVPPTTPVPPKPVTTTTVPPAVPVVPVDGDAPSVCAAAATAVCGPAAPAPADTHAARVQRCQDWWNSLADAFDQNNRPEWATRARDIAGRCEEMITRWEQMQQNGADRQKGDHNGDGHPDNGWNQGQDGPNGHDGQGDHPTPPQAKPQAKQQVSRHGEGRH